MQRQPASDGDFLFGIIRPLPSSRKTWNWYGKRLSTCFLYISYLYDSECHTERGIYVELS